MKIDSKQAVIPVESSLQWQYGGETSRCCNTMVRWLSGRGGGEIRNYSLLLFAARMQLEGSGSKRRRQRNGILIFRNIPVRSMYECKVFLYRQQRLYIFIILSMFSLPMRFISLISQLERNVSVLIYGNLQKCISLCNN